MEPFYSFLLHFSSFFCLSTLLTILQQWLCVNKPWYLVQSKVRQKQSESSISDLIKCFILNEWLITLPFNLLMWELYWKYNLSYTSSNLYRSWIWTLLWEDILFYTFHRLLHIPFLYKHLHHIHHRWKAPSPFGAIYAHPIDHLLVNVLPVYIAPIIGGLPYKHFLIWGILSGVSGATSHSGITFLNSRYHDLHHSEITVNYGVFGIMDKMFGTNQD